MNMSKNQALLLWSAADIEPEAEKEEGSSAEKWREVRTDADQEDDQGRAPRLQVRGIGDGLPLQGGRRAEPGESSSPSVAPGPGNRGEEISARGLTRWYRGGTIWPIGRVMRLDAKETEGILKGFE